MSEVDLAEVQAALLNAPLHRTMNLELESMTPERSEFSASPPADLTNDGASGIIHGGIVAALLDIAACWALYPSGLLGLAVDLHTSFLRPTLPGRLTIVGTPVKLGKTISVSRAELFDDAGKLRATATGTYATPGRKG